MVRTEGDHLDVPTRERILATVLAAFGHRFTGKASPLDHYTWKLEGPLGLPSIAVAGEVEGTVVVA